MPGTKPGAFKSARGRQPGEGVTTGQVIASFAERPRARERFVVHEREQKGIPVDPTATMLRYPERVTVTMVEAIRLAQSLDGAYDWVISQVEVRRVDGPFPLQQFVEFDEYGSIIE